MKLGIRSRNLALLLTLAFTSVAIEVAHADVYMWSSPSALGITGSVSTAISNDGSTMLVGKSATGLWLSTDSGVNFSQISGSGISTTAKFFVAMSSDGQKMFAADAGTTYVYVSTDRGSTWTQSAFGSIDTSTNAACISGNGNVMMTGSTGKKMYLSTDTGTSWAPLNDLGSGSWWGCALNTTGSKRIAMANGGALKIWTEASPTWTSTAGSVLFSRCLAASADGSILAVGAISPKALYLSTNSGGSFTQVYTVANNIYGCSMSSDGSKILVGPVGNQIGISTDFGATWASESSGPSRNWQAIALSGDGKKVIGVPAGAESSYVGSLIEPTTISITSGKSASMVYRAQNTLTATTNYPGRVTFYANGKKIGGCISVLTNSLVATCVYKPSIHGAVTISARVVPTDVTKGNVTQELFRTAIITRTNKR
jgi:hypothetical protein